MSDQVLSRQTLAQKILARAAGVAAVAPGTRLRVKPRFVLAYDFPGILEPLFEQLGTEFGLARMPDPDRYALFIDHMVPAQKPSEEQVHQVTRSWASANGVRLHEGDGIGHQVAAEKGYGLPGALVVHFDRHVSALGAFGALALGIRRQILEAFAFDSVDMEVPGSMRATLHGRPRPGVMARDLFNHLVLRLGPGGCRGHVLELDGPAVAALTIGERMTLCGLATFTGAISAIVAADDVACEWVRRRTAEPFEPLFSDADADYAEVHDIDISDIPPYVVVPPSPANVVPVGAVLGRPADQGYIGSCVSGRLEDLRAAAHVLRGRRIAPGFRLNVVPTSRELMGAAAREGLLEVLVEAGAFVSSPSCDYCFGHIQALAAGQTAVSTGPLNVPGRMGSADAHVYIASAATVAATALAGRIADPTPFFARA